MRHAFPLPSLVCALFLSCALETAALELLWQAETGPGTRGVPVVSVRERGGPTEVIVTSRLDGTIWALSAEGNVVGEYPGPRWVPGGMAVAEASFPPGPVFAYQESGGQLNTLDFETSRNLTINLDGPPPPGLAPVVVDLDGDGTLEIIACSEKGTVHVLGSDLAPRWSSDLGAALAGPVAVAPVFETGPAIYCATRDGTLHALSGQGRPLWTAAVPMEQELCLTGLHFPGHDPLLLVTGGSSLRAVDPVTGATRWDAQLPGVGTGWPAVAEVRSGRGPEVFVINADGHFALFSLSGDRVMAGRFPEAVYTPRPLLGDVDGDGQTDVIVPALDGSLRVAGLDGREKNRVALRGNALDGAVLADLTGDGFLELLVATDAAAVYCFSTSARTGWVHPRGGFAHTGFVGHAAGDAQLPPEQRSRRGLRAHWALTTAFREDSPIGSAFVALRTEPRDDAYFHARVVAGDRVLGSAVGRLTETEFVIPFAYMDASPLAVRVEVLDTRGRVLAAMDDRALDVPDVQPVPLTSGECLLAVGRRGADRWQPAEDWTPPGIDGTSFVHVTKHMPKVWGQLSEDDRRRLLDPGRPCLGLSRGFDAQALEQVPGAFFIDHEDCSFSATSAAPTELLPPEARTRVLGAPIMLSRPPRASDGRPGSGLAPLIAGQRGTGLAHGALDTDSPSGGAEMAYARLGDGVNCAMLQFALLRGAARQNGNKPWGVSVSNRYAGALADTRASGEALPRWTQEGLARGARCGHSPEAEFRLGTASYLAGASFVHHAQNARDGSILIQEDDTGAHVLSPFGEAMAESLDLARNSGPRGVTCTPAAVLVPTGYLWKPDAPADRGGANAPARVIDRVFNRRPLDFEEGVVGGGRSGAFTDIIDATADRDVLGKYGVLLPLGFSPLDEEAWRSLVAFAEAGGIALVDAEALGENRDRQGILGLRLGRRDGAAASVQTAFAAVPHLPAPFAHRPFRVTRRGDARVIAWTGEGAPLIAWHPLGEGAIVFSGTRNWVDSTGAALPLAEVLLGRIAELFLPVHLVEDLTMVLSRAEDKWTIALFNDEGVTKAPTEPTRKEARDVIPAIVRFRGDVPLRFIPRIGSFIWDIRAGGLRTQVPPGGVVVVDTLF